MALNLECEWHLSPIDLLIFLKFSYSPDKAVYVDRLRSAAALYWRRSSCGKVTMTGPLHRWARPLALLVQLQGTA
eukprot:SAG31_NODE_13011_length_899_cov_73.186250_1_plen_74_part_10